MKRLKRVDVLQAAIVTALIYALLSLIILLPMGLLFNSIIPAQEENPFAFFSGVALIFIPIFYGLIGFVGGALSAALYNLVAKWTGGIQVEVEDLQVHETI